MDQRLPRVQWLFLDPSVLLNEGDTDREARRQIESALSRRGLPVRQEQVERAWMQAIAAPRPVQPLVGAVQLLAPDPNTAAAVIDEVIRHTPNRDSLFTGTQLALNALQTEYKLGIIGGYRVTPGTQARLQRFHLHFPIVAVSDEQGLSHKLDVSGKPDPALFIWALRKAGCPADMAAYASDRVDLGLAPAKLAGMSTIWVRQTNYKIRFPRNSTETPDLSVNSLSELVPR